MIDELLVSLEVTAKVLVFVVVTMLLRSLGSILLSRRMTFYKIYPQTLKVLGGGWLLSLMRAELHKRDRIILALTLACYTSALCLFMSNNVEALSSPILFVLLFVAGSGLRLLLYGNYGQSMRQFLFAPILSLLLAILIMGSLIAAHVSALSQAQNIQYVGFYSPILLVSFVLSLILGFLYSLSTYGENSGWERVLEMFSELTFVSPVLFFFLNEGIEISWLSLVPWSIKASAILITFDIAKKFIPRFSARHPEALVLNVAIPLVGLAFLALWMAGAKV